MWNCVEAWWLISIHQNYPTLYPVQANWDHMNTKAKLYWNWYLQIKVLTINFQLACWQLAADLLSFIRWMRTHSDIDLMTARQQACSRLAAICAFLAEKCGYKISIRVYLSKNFRWFFKFSCFRLLFLFLRQRRGIKWQNFLLFRLQLSTHFAKTEYLSSLQRERQNKWFCQVLLLQANKKPCAENSILCFLFWRPCWGQFSQQFGPFSQRAWPYFCASF